jgi:flagellum-specific ATP synthase
MTSLSRVMPMVTSPEHVKMANEVREMMACYHDIEDLVSVGAYKRGTQPKSDRALDKWPQVEAMLRQDKTEFSDYDTTLTKLKELTDG